MERKVYVVLFEMPYEGSTYMGVFSTLELAKKGCEKYANREINWDSTTEVHETDCPYYNIVVDNIDDIEENEVKI
jgi:hypothetical protein